MRVWVGFCFVRKKKKKKKKGGGKKRRVRGNQKPEFFRREK